MLLYRFSISFPFQFSSGPRNKILLRRGGIAGKVTEMAWWQGAAESRLLIAPTSLVATGDTVGRLLSLKHPKTGKATCYILHNGLLQELHWFKQSYSSWFLGDYIYEDGSIQTATPVDPVFILLPVFEDARMKKENDPGKFRQLEEIMFVDDYPGYQYLMSVAEKCMPVVCEMKEIGSSKFFRLDDSKVFTWLHYKVCQLKKALLSLDKNYAAQDEKNTLADAITIIGEYMKDEPWLEVLSNHFKLNLLEQTRKDENFLPAVPAPSNFLQAEDKGESKSKRAGKQAKKARVEPESQNIKDMFSRASKRK